MDQSLKISKCVKIEEQDILEYGSMLFYFVDNILSQFDRTANSTPWRWKKMRTETASSTCHHFQARAREWHRLQLSYAPLDWQFRVSHYGLFLGFEFGLLFKLLNSMIGIPFRGTIHLAVTLVWMRTQWTVLAKFKRNGCFYFDGHCVKRPTYGTGRIVILSGYIY
jgi:hypothetical protein